tara:strand:+ start:1009 stop:1188 length:180 start_codon:yes stop_codon:yes gene_type:complete
MKKAVKYKTYLSEEELREYIQELINKKFEEIKKENEEKRKRAIAYVKKYEEELKNEKSH